VGFLRDTSRREQECDKDDRRNYGNDRQPPVF
jgi:hypothetical protein